MPNPYSGYLTDMSTQAGLDLVAFGNAESILSSQGAPDTLFLEIAWQGGKINRLWDGTQVSTLAAKDQLLLLPQLNGLFKKAMQQVLYP